MRLQCSNCAKNDNVIYNKAGTQSQSEDSIFGGRKIAGMSSNKEAPF